MTDEQKTKLEVWFRLWNSKVAQEGYSIEQKMYVHGKIDAAWQVLDLLLTPEEVEALEKVLNAHGI